MYWQVVRTAAGVVSERRFSGSDRTPNRMQSYWTMYNIMRDTDPERKLPDLFIPKGPREPIPDFFIYEQIKHGVSVNTLSKHMDMSLEEINAIVKRQMVIEAQLTTVRDTLYQGVINETQIIV